MASTPFIGITVGTSSNLGQTPRFGVNQDYVQAIEAAGGTAVLIPPRAHLNGVADVLDKLDGLLLPGGADIAPKFYKARRSPKTEYVDPDRDALELALFNAALARKIPVLAICRGQQLVNVAMGGTLYQDIKAEGASRKQHKTPKGKGRGFLAHTIDVSSGSRLRDIAKRATIEVNSSHHQAVKKLGSGLRVTATSSDGIIEGIETEDGDVIAIQCHPESLTRLTWARNLFRDFVERSKR